MSPGITRFKSYLLATVSSLALAGTAAADGLPYSGAPARLPLANWTGFYIGAHGGVARQNFAITENDEGGSVVGSKNGGVAGGQIGYNWQVRHWVYGLELDASWAGLRETLHSGGTGVIPASTTVSNVDWLASLRGRSGIALDNTLLYLTGGLAWGGVRNGWGLGYTPGLGAGKCCDIASAQTRTGWVVGAGVEHMLSEKWSLRAEALYYDLGSNNVTGLAGATTVHMSATNEVIVGRAGLNLKW